MEVIAKFFDGSKKSFYNESWAECLCDIREYEKNHGACLDYYNPDDPLYIKANQ